MNMSYCRFNNTLIDLQDCESALEEFMYEDGASEITGNERIKAQQLISLCEYIAENYSAEDFEEKCKEYDEEGDEENE